MILSLVIVPGRPTKGTPEDVLRHFGSRALARKAIWALGKTPGPEADQALRRLLDSEDEILRDRAQAQLARRTEQAQGG